MKEFTVTAVIMGHETSVELNESEAVGLLAHADKDIEIADQGKLLALAVGESFIDSDGDEWLRTA